MRLQVTIDAADPPAQAEFWAQAIGYQVEDNSTFVDQLVTDGRLPEAGRLVRNGRSEFVDVTAARDPQGEGPRLFFQKVPEAKVGKNRCTSTFRWPTSARQTRSLGWRHGAPASCTSPAIADRSPTP